VLVNEEQERKLKGLSPRSGELTSSVLSDLYAGILGKGDAFGEVALLDGGSRSASVRTKTVVTVFILTQDRLLEITTKEPRLGSALLWKLARVVTGRLRESAGSLVEHIKE
jgi:CRP/FNR family cyclic AMP-dependent transcriptional regulator